MEVQIESAGDTLLFIGIAICLVFMADFCVQLLKEGKNGFLKVPRFVLSWWNLVTRS